MSVASAALRPARASATLAVLFGLLAVHRAAAGSVETALLVEAGGLAVLAAGFAAHQRGWTVLGAPLVVAGTAVVFGSFALVYTTTGDPVAAAELVPGMLGTAVLSLGVIPARGGGSRRLVKAGAGLLLLGALVVGATRRPGLPALLWVFVLTVLAWDAGENAVGVGTHLGRRATTWPVEGVHVVATAAVGAVAVGAGRAAAGVGGSGLPLPAFVLLLLAVLTLAAALHD